MSPPDRDVRTRHTLLANISQVFHRGLHLHVRAIVISRVESAPTSGVSGARRQQVRLFGPSPAWPICDVDVPDVPHALTESPLHRHHFGGDPVQRIYDLKFPTESSASSDSEEVRSAFYAEVRSSFEITTNLMDGQPIAVREFPPGTPISEVWSALVPAVARAWEAPNFPLLQWRPLEVVMDLHDRAFGSE